MTDVVEPKPKRIQFRLMRPEDAAALQVLRQRAILKCAHPFGTPAEIEAARSPNYFRRQILEGRQRGGKAFLGGWIEGGLIAMAGVRRRKDREGVLQGQGQRDRVRLCIASKSFDLCFSARKEKVRGPWS